MYRNACHISLKLAGRFEKLRGIFDDVKARGCKFALGGEFPSFGSSAHSVVESISNPNVTPADPSRGMFVPVMLVDNPPEDSRLVQEEQFGPILPLLKWTDEADVIKRASMIFYMPVAKTHHFTNACFYQDGTPYGLAASIWGNDIERATRIAAQIEAGSK